MGYFFVTQQVSNPDIKMYHILRVLFNSHSKKHVTNSPHSCLTRLFYSVVTKHGYIKIKTIKTIDSSLKINLDNLMD